MNAEIDHLVLWIRDRDRALDFYEKVVGFPCCNHYRERGGLFPSVRVNERTMLDLLPRLASIAARIIAREWPPSGAGRPINHVCFSLPRGEFDALKHRQQLTVQAISSGKISISGYGFADFFDLAEGPDFKGVDEAQLTAVRDMLSRSAPGVTEPVRAVHYDPAKFGTGSTLFAERRCGGYFTTGAKDKDKKPAPDSGSGEVKL